MTTSPVALAVPGTTAVPPARRRSRWHALRWAVVGAVLLTEIVLVAPSLLPAVATLADADPRWVATAALAAAVSMSFFARTRRRLLAAAGTRVRQRDALGAVYVANSLHATMPGGAAFSAAYTYRWMRARGAAPAAIAWVLLAGGLLSTSALAGLGLLGSLLAGQHADVPALLLDAGVLAVLALAVRHLDRHPHLALRAARGVHRGVNALLRRPPDRGAETVARVAAQLSAVRPRGSEWAAAAGSAVANWSFDAGCLAASVAALHVRGVPLALLLLAYSAGMAANGLSLLPGGIGIVDAAMVLVLVTGGVPAAAALPPVLLYRLISFVGVVAAGWVVAAVRARSPRAAAVPSAVPAAPR